MKQKNWNQRQKVINALRKVWRYSPMRMEALSRAKAGIKTHRCEICGQEFNSKLVEVHHKESLHNIDDWNIFVRKMLCPSSYLQVLCENCHKAETHKQNLLSKPVPRKMLREFL